MEEFIEGVVLQETCAELVGVVAGGEVEEGGGDLVGGLDVDQAWVVGGEEVWDGTPAGGDDRDAVGHGFDDDEAEAFAVIKSWEAENVGFAEELALCFGVGKSDVANGGRVAEAFEGLMEEVVSFGVGKGAGDGEGEFEGEMV